jgi:hypothetical protein
MSDADAFARRVDVAFSRGLGSNAPQGPASTGRGVLVIVVAPGVAAAMER